MTPKAVLVVDEFAMNFLPCLENRCFHIQDISHFLFAVACMCMYGLVGEGKPGSRRDEAGDEPR